MMLVAAVVLEEAGQNAHLVLCPGRREPFGPGRGAETLRAAWAAFPFATDRHDSMAAAAVVAHVRTRKRTWS